MNNFFDDIKDKEKDDTQSVDNSPQSEVSQEIEPMSNVDESVFATNSDGNVEYEPSASKSDVDESFFATNSDGNVEHEPSASTSDVDESVFATNGDGNVDNESSESKSKMSDSFFAMDDEPVTKISDGGFYEEDQNSYANASGDFRLFSNERGNIFIAIIVLLCMLIVPCSIWSGVINTQYVIAANGQSDGYYPEIKVGETSKRIMIGNGAILFEFKPTVSESVKIYLNNKSYLYSITVLDSDKEPMIYTILHEEMVCKVQRGETYYIQIKSFLPEITSSLRLCLEKASTSGDPDTEIKLDIGESSASTQVGSTGVYFRFKPTVSARVEIYTTHTKGDPMLELCDVNKKTIKSDDDSGGDTDASIIYPVTANKTYYILLKSADRSMTNAQVKVRTSW